MSRGVRNAEECVRALEKTLAAMEPPLDDVHDGILRLIAGLVPYFRFGTSGGVLAYFRISDDGLTATQKGVESGHGTRFACALPSITEGVHEATFLIGRCQDIALGVVPAAKVATAASEFGAMSNGRQIGYTYKYSGAYRIKGRSEECSVRYDEGDAVTVILDLDANTVAFQKNGENVGESPKTIERDEKYFFAFDAYCEGDAVTILEIK